MGEKTDMHRCCSRQRERARERERDRDRKQEKESEEEGVERRGYVGGDLTGFTIE